MTTDAGRHQEEATPEESDQLLQLGPESPPGQSSLSIRTPPDSSWRPPEWSWSKQILLPIESSVEPIVKLEFRFFNDEVLPVGALGSQRSPRRDLG